MQRKFNETTALLESKSAEYDGKLSELTNRLKESNESLSTSQAEHKRIKNELNTAIVAIAKLENDKSSLRKNKLERYSKLVSTIQLVR